jgi:hypothetical protein
MLLVLWRILVSSFRISLSVLHAITYAYSANYLMRASPPWKFYWTYYFENYPGCIILLAHSLFYSDVPNLSFETCVPLRHHSFQSVLLNTDYPFVFPAKLYFVFLLLSLYLTCHLLFYCSFNPLWHWVTSLLNAFQNSGYNHAHDHWAEMVRFNVCLIVYPCCIRIWFQIMTNLDVR